ncbi:Ig-like domain-containing protein, partial [Hyunsoonleella pacifica]
MKLFLVLSMFFSALTVFSQATPTFGGAQGPTLLSGTQNQQGSRYLYTDVVVNVNGSASNADAVVTIIELNNITVNNVDTTLGVDNRFEPSTTTTAAGGYVEWEIQFVEDGTANASTNGVPILVDSYTLEAIDVDGNEFFEVAVPDSYTLEAGNTPTPGGCPQGSGATNNNIGCPTDLVVSTNGIFTRFQSDSDFSAGINAARTEFVVSVIYNNISTVRFRNGRATSGGQRQNSVSFLGEVNFINPSITTLNSPPVVVDNLGNTISSNSQFNGNVLNGSSDPDGNLDQTTVRLIDPSNPSNQGTVGNPLIISGVGTYTVDTSGNVVFVPELDYVGDASILFSVEDDLGVGSNQGNLQITLVDPCVGGTSGTLVWETVPTNNSEFDWTPDGALSNTFNNISGTSLNTTISFTGDTGTLAGWNFGAGDTPEVNTDNGVEALQFFTTGFDATGITITLAFSQPVNEVEFNLAHVNGQGPNGDSYTITASEVGGGTLFPVFTESANPSYTTNTSGFVDSNDNSTVGDNDEVGVNFSSSNGINSITLIWDECTACNPGTVHGSAIQDISFCFLDSTPTAVDDTASVDEDDTVNIDVLDDDNFGGDGPSTGTISITSGPTNGVATVNDGGTPNDPTDDTIDYTPTADYNGPDQITYEICDADGDCVTAVVDVTVNAVDD